MAIHNGACTTTLCETRYWAPTMGGVLMIISGLVNVISAFAVLFSAPFLPAFLISGGGVVFGLFMMALGIISIVGGINAVRHDSWAWALAGAIAAVIPYLILGLASLVLVLFGKPAFARTT